MACEHPYAIPGLDHACCPTCGSCWPQQSQTYREIMTRPWLPSSRSPPGR
jgi:hypothetical protein